MDKTKHHGKRQGIASECRGWALATRKKEENTFSLFQSASSKRASFIPAGARKLEGPVRLAHLAGTDGGL
jgi:hypothetical protein